LNVPIRILRTDKRALDNLRAPKPFSLNEVCDVQA
jgi:hypothetical protein